MAVAVAVAVAGVAGAAATTRIGCDIERPVMWTRAAIVAGRTRTAINPHN